MAFDAWLPIGFQFPDRQRVASILSMDRGWQIVETGVKQAVLVVQSSLADRWTRSGLLDESCLQRFSFGADKFAAIASGPSHALASLQNCRSPVNKTEAIAFATSIRETRAHDRSSSLHDGLYCEKLSRLLPTYSDEAKISDDLVLGTWLSGGLRVSVFPLRRMHKILSWLDPGELESVVDAAGFKVGELASSNGLEAEKGPVELSNRVKVRDKEVNSSERPFQLPGRKVLEEFFNEYVIEIIQNQDRYSKLGIKFPPAIILEGPPGCGKTFAVEQLVEYLGWPLYSVDSSSIGSPYIHATSKKVAEVFEQAIEHSPSVVVIDEMEAFLADRNAGAGSSHHRVEEVAEFLRKIPEAVKNGVLVIGMTNRLDMIDQAILRRGRFDQIIKVDYAGEFEVAALLESLLRDLPKSDDIDIAFFAQSLTGRPLSDVSYVVREGARLAAREKKSSIDNQSLTAALASAPSRDPDASPRRIGFT